MVDLMPLQVLRISLLVWGFTIFLVLPRKKCLEPARNLYDLMVVLVVCRLRLDLCGNFEQATQLYLRIVSAASD